MNYLVFDLETTGTEPMLHGIHQIAGRIVKEEKPGVLKLTSKFVYNVRPLPDVEMDPEALKAGKVTEKEMKKYPKAETVFNHIHDLLRGEQDGERYVLVGYYNMHLDNPFFRLWWDQMSKKKSGTMVTNPYGFNTMFHNASIDVASLAAYALRDKIRTIRNWKLATVAEYMGIAIDEEDLHNAEYDAWVTDLLFQRLMWKIEGFK